MRIGEAIRQRIIELCNEHDINVNQLSLMCGMTQSTLNNIVNGRNHSTTVSTIQRVPQHSCNYKRNPVDAPVYDGKRRNQRHHFAQKSRRPGITRPPACTLCVLLYGVLTAVAV